MAKYRVLVPSFVDGFLVDDKMIAAAGETGYIVEYAGEVSRNLQPVNDTEKKKAVAEAAAAQDALRAEAIELALTEDNSPGGKPIDDKTPIEIVKKILATSKQNRTD